MNDKNNNIQNKYLSWSKKLNQIGIALSSEKNILKLLEMILGESRDLTNCDAGTFYRINKNKKKLLFTVVHNDSMKEYSGGTSGDQPSFPPVELYNNDGSPNLNAVSSYVFHKSEVVSIPDIYRDQTPLSEGSKMYEKISGYRTNSMLVVPMINHDNEVIGVLQLLNAKNNKDEIVPFDEEFNDIIQSLGSQAAVALDTVELIDDIEKLLNSLIKYTVNAIDERSPHTAGHSSRVAKFTRKIAESINDKKEGPFKDIFFDNNQLEEVWVAGLMHDVGKIGVPENVLEKQNRLDATKEDKTSGRPSCCCPKLIIDEQTRFHVVVVTESNGGDFGKKREVSKDYQDKGMFLYSLSSGKHLNNYSDKKKGHFVLHNYEFKRLLENLGQGREERETLGKIFDEKEHSNDRRCMEEF